MTNTITATHHRWYLTWALIFLFFCVDSMTGTPKYFSAGAYLSLVFAFSIKGFNYYESSPWGRVTFNSLNVIALTLLVISIGRRIFGS
jgi:hypothetical protein